MLARISKVTLAVVIVIGLMGCEVIEPEISTLETSFLVEFTPTIIHIYDGRQISLGMHRDEIEEILILQHVAEYGVRHWYESLFIGYSNNKVTSILVAPANTNWLMAGISIGDNIQPISDSVRFMNLDYNFQLIDEDLEFITGMLSVKYGEYVFGFNYYYNTGRIIMMALFSESEDLEFLGF